MFNPFLLVTDAINAMHSNIWALCLVGAGTLMVLKGHPEGSALSAAGLAIFKTSSDNLSLTQKEVPEVKEDHGEDVPKA